MNEKTARPFGALADQTLGPDDRQTVGRLAVEDQVFAADTGLVNGEVGVLLGHYQVIASLGRLRAAF
jgi:hypothetical protein